MLDSPLDLNQITQITVLVNWYVNSFHNKFIKKSNMNG